MQQHAKPLWSRDTDNRASGKPGAVHIKSWQSKFTPSEQRQGLQDGLGDIAEEGFRLSPDERQKIDDRMRSESLMTLSELQVRHGKRIRRLLKKTRLLHEEDAIALKGFVDADLLGEQDAEIAMRLVDTFKR